MEGNGRVFVPGQVGITNRHIPGPNATPYQVVMQAPNEVCIVSMGGMTKREQIVTQLICAEFVVLEDLKLVMPHLCDIADTIIAGCEQHTAPKDGQA